MCGPVAVAEVVAVGGVLDHAVKRDVLDDFQFSHMISSASGLEFDAAGMARKSPSLKDSRPTIMRVNDRRRIRPFGTGTDESNAVEPGFAWHRVIGGDSVGQGTSG